LLIKGGRLIDPAARIDALMDVLLRDGQVAEVVPPGKTRGTAHEKFDARGLIVAPGFIDLHVHLREPGQGYKETIATGTAAAAAGGFTSVCCMPNTQPVLDSPEWVTWIQRPERGAVVNVFPIAAATHASKGAVLTDFRGLQRAGAVAVTDDGKPILNDTVMRDTLRLSSEINLPVIQHAEDTRMTDRCSMNDGPTSFRLGLRGMKAAAESSIVERDVQLAQQFTGARLHVAHISTADALKAVRRGKRGKSNVTCEVTPHHFALTDADVGEYDTNFKMNPPLRTPADRRALIAGLRDGTLDCISTDHAPHTDYEKDKEFDYAPNGILGLETSLAVSLGVLVRENKFKLAHVVDLMTRRPAAVLALPAGTLTAGAAADICLFDPAEKWRYDAKAGFSKSSNSPWHGQILTGRVKTTIVDGRVVFDGGKIVPR